MSTLREIATLWTAEEIEAEIVFALEDRDFPGVDALLRLLVVKDPRRAEIVYQTLRVGVEAASRRLNGEQ